MSWICFHYVWSILIIFPVICLLEIPHEKYLLKIVFSFYVSATKKSFLAITFVNGWKNQNGLSKKLIFLAKYFEKKYGFQWKPPSHLTSDIIFILYPSWTLYHFEFKSVFNPFHSTGPFLYLLYASENLLFSDVFRGCVSWFNPHPFENKTVSVTFPKEH